jgi:hypothetical protein
MRTSNLAAKVLLATTTVLAACLASAAFAAPVESCKTWIVFQNPSKSPVRLEPTGESARVLGPGQTARICPSAPGDKLTYRVVADAGWVYEGTVQLTGLQTREVPVIVPCAGVRVRNRTGEPQTLEIDGRPMGVVEDGAQRTVTQLEPGTVTVVARSARSATLTALRLNVAAGEVAEAALPAPASRMAVVNPLTELATLYVDGHAYGRIGPAAATVDVLGLAPGMHRVRLVGVTSGDVREFEAKATLTSEPPGLSPDIRIRVENQTGEVLELVAAMRDLGSPIALGAKAEWVVPRSAFGISATGADSGLTYRLEVQPDGPAQLDWRIERPRASVKLMNVTGESLTVHVGAWGKVEVPANAKRVVGVPAGRLALTAEAKASGRKHETGLFLEAAAQAAWSIRAEETTVTLVNGHGEPATVAVDGAVRGTIPARGELRTAVTPGKHRITFVTQWTGTRLAAELQVADGARALVGFEPPSGALHLDQRTGEHTLVVLVRGVQMAEVAPGSHAVLPVVPGRATVEVRDPKTGRSAFYSDPITPAEQVLLPKPPLVHADLEIALAGEASVTVAVDGGEVQPLKPGETLKLSGVPVGEHLIDVRVGGKSLRRRVEVRPDRPVTRVELRPTRP